MRQRGATSTQPSIATTLRRIVVLAFAVWLACSALPLAVSATPPAPENSWVTVETATPPDNDSELPVHEVDGAAARQSRSIGRTPSSLALPGWGSVRPRGFEAPVQLRPPAPEPAQPEVEKGDGIPQRSSAKPERKPERNPRQDDSAEQRRNVRVWPMRAQSYTFTQPFGCVPQIANFYFPGEGCPADAPVIHSGIDLAAPEGTPFYAAAAGWVTDSGYDREVGVPNTRIIIQHVGRNNGYATEYLHWIASYVEVGDYVEAGDMIGEVGSVGYSTGPHLHFSVVDLDSGEHIDPIGWLPKSPGNEGYRGVQPRAKASMRLPAGTTAGLPETADPAPPPPPERQDVPDSPREGERGKKGNGKHKRDRQDERAAKREATPSDPSDRSAEKANSRGSAADDSADREKANGKRRDRTRERERHKDGKSREGAAKGDDGDEPNADDGSDTSRSGDKSKHENRGGRRDNVKNAGHHNRDKKDQDGRGKTGGKKDKGSGGKDGKDTGGKSSNGDGANSPDNGRGSRGNSRSGSRNQPEDSENVSPGDADAGGEQPVDPGASDNHGNGNDTAETPSKDPGDSRDQDAPDTAGGTRAPQAASDDEAKTKERRPGARDAQDASA